MNTMTAKGPGWCQIQAVLGPLRMIRCPILKGTEDNRAVPFQAVRVVSLLRKAVISRQPHRGARDRAGLLSSLTGELTPPPIHPVLFRFVTGCF